MRWHGRLWEGQLSGPNGNTIKNSVKSNTKSVMQYGISSRTLEVRKFLPSYEGPYFIVGLLDDLVYRIKKGPRTKTKVVHHDKLKPFYSRTPLDNGWVFKDTDAWAPVEGLPLQLGSSSMIPALSSLSLGEVASDREDSAVEALPGLFSSLPVSLSNSQLPDSPCYGHNE